MERTCVEEKGVVVRKTGISATKDNQIRLSEQNWRVASPRTWLLSTNFWFFPRPCFYKEENQL